MCDGADGAAPAPSDAPAPAPAPPPPPPEAAAVAMQFGKVARDAYALDFDPSVLTAAQAFAVALTTFEAKVLL